MTAQNLIKGPSMTTNITNHPYLRCENWWVNYYRMREREREGKDVDEMKLVRHIHDGRMVDRGGDEEIKEGIDNER